MMSEARTTLWVLIGIVAIAIGYAIFGWAGISRCASGCIATATGADWVVVQLDCSGRVVRCWQLEGVSISNEANSDGIYWEQASGNLVHISNLYNRVQVVNENWQEAFEMLGATAQQCVRFGSNQGQGQDRSQEISPDFPVATSNPEGL